MASNSMYRTHRTFRESSRRLGVLGCLALAWVASCSLRNLDELGPSESVAGKSSVGGAGNQGGGNSGGAANPSGGASATGGAINPNTSGGSGGGGAVQGGATAAGGTIATGGTTGKPICPVYTSPSGTLVTPPSNDFENEALEWSTTNEHPYSNTVVNDPDSACLGKQYLSSDGQARQNQYDGPGIDLVRYVTLGHLYTLSVAVRFSPKEAAGTGAIQVTIARGCAGSVDMKYQTLTQRTGVGTSWTRITYATPFSVNQGWTDCASLRKIFFYVETPNAVDAARTIEVDDFQLWDMTAGAGGAGGAGGVGGGGAAGAAGMAGAAGSR